jgi:putative sigma-54 modulation protein
VREERAMLVGKELETLSEPTPRGVSVSLQLGRIEHSRCPGIAKEEQALMNISITFRHMDATDAVKVYANEKVAKLQRFLRGPMKGQVTLSCQLDRLHRVEVDIHAGHDHFHAHETSEDMYASIDKVTDKIERQILSAKESVKSRRKGADRATEHLSVDVGEE